MQMVFSYGVPGRPPCSDANWRLVPPVRAVHGTVTARPKPGQNKRSAIMQSASSSGKWRAMGIGVAVQKLSSQKALAPSKKPKSKHNVNQTARIGTGCEYDLVEKVSCDSTRLLSRNI